MSHQRNIRRKYYIIAIIFSALMFYSYCCPQSRSSKDTTVTMSNINLKHVVVHVDLKRTPLRLSYLTRLLALLRRLGVTGLLMEYEDMFPYEGELLQLRNPNCYTKDELTNFLKKNKELHLEVIPLVQTFGHLESVLQLKKFSSLRESAAHSDSICPSKEKSQLLIKEMLSQVMTFHASVDSLKHIHIGCDEVFHLNMCKKCILRRLPDEKLVIQHIRTVTSMVKNISQDTNVLIWDDMLRFTHHRIENMTAEPVVWNYHYKVELNHLNFFKYHKAFNNIWIASAFKGADGEYNVLPNVKNRFLNSYTWLNGIHDYMFAGENVVYNFKGIILTGWSRYNFKKPVVDILPASLPSLILNLLLVSQFRSGFQLDYVKEPSVFYAKYLHENMLTVLGCDVVDIELKSSDIDTASDIDSLSLGLCNFSEYGIYKSIKEYLKHYNTRGIFDTKQQNNVLVKTAWCKNVSNKMYHTNCTLFRDMKKYYDADFVTEYVSYLISNLQDYIKKLCLL